MLTAVAGEPSDSGMIIGSLETLQKICTHNYWLVHYKHGVT